MSLNKKLLQTAREEMAKQRENLPNDRAKSLYDKIYNDCLSAGKNELKILQNLSRIVESTMNVHKRRLLWLKRTFYGVAFWTRTELDRPETAKELGCEDSENILEIADALVLDGYLDIVYEPLHSYHTTDEGMDYNASIESMVQYA